MMDEMDQKIIAILTADGRAGNNAIARQLGVSEGTVRNRIKRLTESEMLRVSGRINPDAVPDRQLFLLGIKVSVSKELCKIAELVAREPEVQSVSIITGRYDLMVEVWLPVKRGLIDFIDGPMAAIDGIVSTESFLAMRSMKKWIDPVV